MLIAVINNCQKIDLYFVIVLHLCFVLFTSFSTSFICASCWGQKHENQRQFKSFDALTDVRSEIEFLTEVFKHHNVLVFDLSFLIWGNFADIFHISKTANRQFSLFFVNWRQKSFRGVTRSYFCLVQFKNWNQKPN